MVWGALPVCAGPPMPAAAASSKTLSRLGDMSEGESRRRSRREGALRPWASTSAGRGTAWRSAVGRSMQSPPADERHALADVHVSLAADILASTSRREAPGARRESPAG